MFRITVIFVWTLILGVMMFCFNLVVWSNFKTSNRLERFECGFTKYNNHHSRFNLQVFLLLIVFICFDLELVFLCLVFYSWNIVLVFRFTIFIILTLWMEWVIGSILFKL